MPRLFIRTFFVNDKMPKGDEKMKKGKTNWKIKKRGEALVNKEKAKEVKDRKNKGHFTFFICLSSITQIILLTFLSSNLYILLKAF